MKKSVLNISLVFLLIGSSVSVVAMEDDRNGLIARSPSVTQEGVNDVVSATATRIYNQINTHWTYVASKKAMYTESKLWEAKWKKGLIMEQGKKLETSVPTLVLKTSPDNLIDALEDLIVKPASVECTIALMTAKIFCLRDLLGDEIFKQYAIVLYTLLKEKNVEEFFYELPSQFLTTVQQPAVPGSITYITNSPFYVHFKPNGNGRGSNVFCTSQDQYLGFSAIYKTGSQPLVTIESQDLTLFTKKEDVEQNHEQHTNMSQSFINTPENFTKMRRKAQKLIDFYQFFDLKKLKELMETGTIYYIETSN